MFYGNSVQKLDDNLTIQEISFDSVVYNEYLNRKSLLESCLDDSDKVILEAQVEVLCEASIKDIIDKLKKLVVAIIEGIKAIIKKAAKCIKKLNVAAKIKELDKRNKELEIANDILKGNVKSLNYEIDDRDKSSNEKINKSEKQIEVLKNKIKSLFDKSVNDPLLYFNLNNYLDRDYASKTMFDKFANVVMLGDGEVLNGKDIERFSAGLRDVFRPDFDDCFEDREYRFFENYTTIKIYSDFSGYKEVIKKISEKELEKSNSINDCTSLKKQLKDIEALNNIYGAHFNLGCCLDTLNDFNKKLGVNKSHNNSDEDKNVFEGLKVANCLIKTLEGMSGCFEELYAISVRQQEYINRVSAELIAFTDVL